MVEQKDNYHWTKEKGNERVTMTAALDILNEAGCPTSIDLPWHFSLMIYDMVTLNVLVASYAADITLILFLFFFFSSFISFHRAQSKKAREVLVQCTVLHLSEVPSGCKRTNISSQYHVIFSLSCTFSQWERSEFMRWSNFQFLDVFNWARYFSKTSFYHLNSSIPKR